MSTILYIFLSIVPNTKKHISHFNLTICSAQICNHNVLLYILYEGNWNTTNFLFSVSFNKHDQSNTSLHLWLCTEHKCSISAIAVGVKPHFIRRFTSVLTGRVGLQPSNPFKEKKKIQNQSRHFLFCQTTKTQQPDADAVSFCLSNQTGRGTDSSLFLPHIVYLALNKSSVTGDDLSYQCLHG